MERITHNFAPVYDHSSRILILGTFPSVKSREMDFYYGHPQNRFWRVMAALFSEPAPESIEDKKIFLLSHGIALWDVVAACTITGSSDSSIRDVIPNDISRILAAAPIQGIFANGAKAAELYTRFCFPRTQRPCAKLPSTSPANAAYSLARLEQGWRASLGIPPA